MSATMEIRDVASKVEREAAYQAVLAEIRAGRMVRPDTCAWCDEGDGQTIQMHHPADYARPLMVVWLCGPCHRAHHLRYRSEVEMRRRGDRPVAPIRVVRWHARKKTDSGGQIV